MYYCGAGIHWDTGTDALLRVGWWWKLHRGKHSDACFQAEEDTEDCTADPHKHSDLQEREKNNICIPCKPATPLYKAKPIKSL